MALWVLLLLASCASSPQAAFYTLSPQAPSEPNGTPGPKAIVISTVTVPEIVDRPQFVLRVNATEVNVDEFARWADPLKSQIRRVVAADLLMEFPKTLVSGYPGASDPASTYQVSMDVQSFESKAGEFTEVSVLWTVRPPKGAPVSGRSVAREATVTPGYDSLVAAQSRALASVSHDVATAIRLGAQ
jgi:uncharacterized protein